MPPFRGSRIIFLYICIPFLLCVSDCVCLWSYFIIYAIDPSHILLTILCHWTCRNNFFYVQDVSFRKSCLFVNVRTTVSYHSYHIVLYTFMQQEIHGYFPRSVIVSDFQWLLCPGEWLSISVLLENVGVSVSTSCPIPALLLSSHESWARYQNHSCLCSIPCQGRK